MNANVSGVPYLGTTNDEESGVLENELTQFWFEQSVEEVRESEMYEIQSGILADKLAAVMKQRSREWGPLLRTKKRHR